VTRFIGVDSGSKRVGLAISDGLGLTAQPLEVVARAKAVDRILELVAEYEIDTVVMGLPTGLSGGEGVSAQEARSLGEELTSGDLEVEFIDERFTSRMAEEVLLESGMKRRDRRDTVDKVAAAIILQGYLDRRARGNSNPGNPGAV
jgi:putative Holliday junction resolvase